MFFFFFILMTDFLYGYQYLHNYEITDFPIFVIFKAISIEVV